MAMRFVLAVIFFGLSFVEANILIESRDEQLANSAQTLLRVRVFNDSKDALQNVELRYFLSCKERPIILDKHHPQNLSAEIVTSGSECPFLKISIPLLFPGMYPDSGGMALGLHFSDWSGFKKEADFSEPESDSFQLTEKIVVYIGGEYVRGILRGTLSSASPISLRSGSEIPLGPGENVHFAWREVEGAGSYRLNVVSAKDSSVVLQEVTEKNRMDAVLDSGEYLWNVESSAYSKGSAFWTGKTIQFDNPPQRLRVLLDTSYVMSKTLDVVPRAARKDTKLLDVKWGEMAVAREWDRPHLEHEHYDEEEGFRCWAVGAQMLNHYYGGNITQDEIKLKFKNHFGIEKLNVLAANKILGAFLHSSQGALSVSLLSSVVRWTLNENSFLHEKNLAPSDKEVMEWINAGAPLYVWTHKHVMIIDAYRLSLSKRLDVRLLNTDNDGTVEWRTLRSVGLEGFVAVEVQGTVRMTDGRIHTDSDHDGLMDYDEIERFGTDPKNADSDGDGIKDKTEIFSYTIREKLEGSVGNFYRGIEVEIYADIDDDSLRAELDFDSDGGGISDGMEDKNKNGIRDSGETDVFDEMDDNGLMIADLLDVPGNLTVYARGKLWINDGVKCFAEKNCDVASEAKDSAYAVNIGRIAYVRRIESKGGVLLRDYANVTGNVRIYSLPQKNLNAVLQNNVNFARVSFPLLEALWPYRIVEIPAMPEVGDSIKEIAYHESYTIQNGDRLKTLKVHSGGTLFIAPGEMFVGSIQLESGSKVHFVNPGQRTVLHLNGSAVWRAQNTNENLGHVAKGFMLIQHGSEEMAVEGMWAGTIFAPNADLILGQSSKKLHGRFLGKDITVHQYATVYHVKFEPENTLELVRRGK